MTIPAGLADPTNYGNRPGDGPLRPGGVPASGIPSKERDLPSTPSQAVSNQHHALEMCRDIEGGAERIKRRAQTYLPKAPGESQANYDVRLARSVFFNVFSHTIEGLVGQVFRKDIAIGDDVPASIVQHMENIDNAGTHFDVFARDLLHDALIAGHCAVLVEFPKTGGAQLHSDERGPAAPIRPYWVPIKKDSILSWRTTTVDGRLVLTQLVIEECAKVADGQFGEKDQTRYRVFYRDDAGVVGFNLFSTSKEKVLILEDSGLYPTQDEIPVAEIATSGRVGLFESVPPLLDLAYLNVAHYQQYSDYVTSIHKTCVPLLTLIGWPADDDGKQALVVGPNSVLKTENPQAKAEYVSHSGQALNSCKESLDDLKSDMGTLGLSMLSPSKRTAETAQAKRLDKSTEDSSLATTARGTQDGLERALGFHAKYLKEKSGGSLKVNKQFDTQAMDAATMTAWTGAVKDAGIPERLMLDAMQVGELIDADENVDDIAGEMAANQAAKADQEAQAAKDQLAMKLQAQGQKTVPVDQAAA